MTAAKWIIFIVAVANYLAFLVDGVIPATAKQHLRNPHWPPHAKFHNAQTMMIGLLNGTIALVLLFTGPLTVSRLLLAAAVASSYYLAMLLASLFPATRWTDPEFVAETPRPLGLAPQQLLSYLLCGLSVVAVLLTLYSAR